MATAVFREVKHRNPACHVTFYTSTKYLEVAESCPFIDQVRPAEDAPGDAIWMNYARLIRPGRPLRRPLVKTLGDFLGVKVRDVRPTWSADSVEVARFQEAWADLPRPWVVVTRKASGCTPNKDWQNENWETLIDRLLTGCSVIEVGTPQSNRRHRSQPNYVDLVGQTTLAQLTAAIAAGDLHVGPLTGTVHIAAALGIPSVVICGGYEPPQTTDYQGNVILCSTVSCAPCWLNTPCPYDKKCLREITPDQVEAAVNTVWNTEKRAGN
ncbi:MAG: glycosyltransferase family 9 protein [Isosphaeraceae bacterium]